MNDEQLQKCASIMEMLGYEYVTWNQADNYFIIKSLVGGVESKWNPIDEYSSGDTAYDSRIISSFLNITREIIDGKVHVTYRGNPSYEFKIIPDTKLINDVSDVEYEIRDVVLHFAATQGVIDWIIHKNKLWMTDDDADIRRYVKIVIEENSKIVTEYINGNNKVYNSLFGKIMKFFHGRVNPISVDQILKSELCSLEVDM